MEKGETTKLSVRVEGFVSSVGIDENLTTTRKCIDVRVYIQRESLTTEKCIDVYVYIYIENLKTEKYIEMCVCVYIEKDLYPHHHLFSMT